MTIKKHSSDGRFGKVLIAILFIAIAAIGSAGGYIMSERSGVKLASEIVTLNIENGASASSIARQLSDEGIIKFPFIFKLEARKNNYASSIKPGIIEIKDGMSYHEILELLCSDNRNSKKLVIPEGFEQKQIRERIVSEGFCTAEEFDAAVNDDYGYDFLTNLPERPYRLEGYLYPDTYIIHDGAGAHDIINMMLAEFDAHITDEMRSKISELPVSGFTLDNVITMASIIERETDSDTERAKVAGIFYNRLNQNMKLQSCATVQYILGERKSVLSIADTQIDSPYNTYVYSGLPSGPIANPGIDCINAALEPEETDYLYFVAGKDGQHIFSKTYEEHLAAMNSAESAVKVEGEGN
ncbi:MAG: endolytic transglycosylase MltG [bacterium]|nr:endolytic transglycosylase MltG [bacterium]